VREPIAIAENIEYIESFGPSWVQAVLLRRVDLDFLEQNRKRVSHQAAPLDLLARGCSGKRLSFLNLNFEAGAKCLATDLKNALLEKFEFSAALLEVQKILVQARLVKGDLRWRTEFHNGEWNIARNEEPSINSLGALAHELGHCLHERFGSRNPGIKSQIDGEAAAMAIEEWIVTEALPLELRSQWSAHQRRLDTFNEAFFALENGYSDSILAEPHLMPLRESFFSVYGYQRVYYEASRARRRILSSWPKTVDELMDGIGLNLSA